MHLFAPGDPRVKAKQVLSPMFHLQWPGDEALINFDLFLKGMSINTCQICSCHPWSQRSLLPPLIPSSTDEVSAGIHCPEAPWLKKPTADICQSSRNRGTPWWYRQQILQCPCGHQASYQWPPTDRCSDSGFFSTPTIGVITILLWQ